MGMFKSALRARLLAGGSLGTVPRDLNTVLIPLKSAPMYVTFASTAGQFGRQLDDQRLLLLRRRPEVG